MNAVKETARGYFSPSSHSHANSVSTTVAFVCFVILSFFLGTAASALFDLASNPMARTVVDRYLSYELPEGAAGVTGGFMSIIQTDIALVLLIFLFGLCVFPLIGLLPILFYRGLTAGIAVGISISSSYITPASAVPVLMLAVTLLLPLSAMSISASAAFRFSHELKRSGCSPGHILSSGMLKKYIFIAAVAVGILAVSAGVQLLYYRIF